MSGTESRRRYGITVPFDGVPLGEHRSWYERLLALGYTDVWSAETDGVDGFTPLALAAAWTPELQLGVAIIPAYTRGPALLAQSVAAMAEAAPGRFTFGLGTSSDVIVHRWNGIPFDEPFRRARDTIAFLRMALAGEKIDREFETFTVRGFRLARPVEQPPPIYLAALRPGMLHLAGREADGVILNWLSADDVKTVRGEVGTECPAAARYLRLSLRGRRGRSGRRSQDDRRLSQRRRLRSVPPLARSRTRARTDVVRLAGRRPQGRARRHPRRDGRRPRRPRFLRRMPGPRRALRRERGRHSGDGGDPARDVARPTRSKGLPHCGRRVAAEPARPLGQSRS